MENNKETKKVDRKKEWFVLFKYIVSGATSVVLQFLLLYFFVDICHLFSPVASTLAYIITTICLYMMLYHWAFKSNGNHGVIAFRYAITSTIMLGLNFFIFWAMTEYFQIWYIYGQIAASSIVALVNYVVNRLYTFY